MAAVRPARGASLRERHKSLMGSRNGRQVAALSHRGSTAYRKICRTRGDPPEARSFPRISTLALLSSLCNRILGLFFGANCGKEESPMRFQIIIDTSPLRSMAALVVTAILLSPLGLPVRPPPIRSTSFSAPGGGSGQITMSDGKQERLKCNAYYTGGGSQLGMAIRCQSESSNVEIRSKLSQSADALPAPGKSAPSMPRETPSGRPRATRSASRSAAA